MTTESDRVLAAGVPIELSDGRQVTLRYGNRALKLLEDRFGGLGAVQDIVSSDGTGPVIGPLMDLLAAGLVREGLSADDLLDLTDPSDIESYVDAIARALEQAFPEKKVGKAGANPTGPFLGQTSTTSPPVDTAAAMVSSGK